MDSIAPNLAMVVQALANDGSRRHAHVSKALNLCGNCGTNESRIESFLIAYVRRDNQPLL
jgi:hypothetical protein